MKGFIYLLEISVAMILIMVVLATISSFRSSESWERSDLIDSVRYVSDSLDSQDIADLLMNDTSKIDLLVPKNMRYALSISGAAKSNISVGCVNSCDFVRSMLTPSYVNGRWVNFTVIQFDPESLNYIPQYDAIVLVNYTRYSQRKANIISYMNAGGTVIGINGTYASNPDFNDIFGLSSSVSSSGDFVFSAYDPSSDETEKYFMYTGFNVNTSNAVSGKKWGTWFVWNIPRMVNITSGTVDIENKSSDEGLIQGIPQGGYFSIKSPVNGKFYTFNVSKIFWDSSVTLQPMNSSFVFSDFTDSGAVRGKFNVVSFSNDAEMTANGSAVWISDFPQSDEYSLLVKSAIISNTKEYDASVPDTTKKYVAFSSFYPMCCDVPETAKVTLYMWYRI